MIALPMHSTCESSQCSFSCALRHGARAFRLQLCWQQSLRCPTAQWASVRPSCARYAATLLSAAAVAVCLPRHAAHLRVQVGHLALGACHIVVLGDHFRVHRLRSTPLQLASKLAAGQGAAIDAVEAARSMQRLRHAQVVLWHAHRLSGVINGGSLVFYKSACCDRAW